MLRVKLIEAIIADYRKRKPDISKEFCDWLRTQMNNVYEEAYKKGRNMARGHIKKD